MKPRVRETNYLLLNMSAIFYEPFYDIERLFDESLFGRQDPGREKRRIGPGEANGAPRSLKPR